MPKHILIVTAVATLVAAPASAQKNPDLAPYLMSDRAAEIALARTAAPKRISDSATVLVLTRKGYVQAAQGNNGFTCLVAPSFIGALADPNFWSPKVRAPHCFNPPAVRTVLPAILKRAEWIVNGRTPTEIGTLTDRAYASHELAMPASGAMAYMFSKQQYLLDANPHWMPHLMFFYDKSMPVATWGAGGATEAVIDGSANDTHNPVLTLFIPVRRWSDGSTAMAASGH